VYSLHVKRAHCHGIFGLSEYHQERTSPTYSQRKNNPRQLHPHTQKLLCPNVVVLKWSVSLVPNPCTTVGRVNASATTHKTSTVDITSSPCSIWLVTWSFGVDYSHMETGPLVWWKCTMMEWLTLKWSATLLWLKPPLCMPTACHLSGMVNFRRTIPNQ
jgi:hypothetical protein